MPPAQNRSNGGLQELGFTSEEALSALIATGLGENHELLGSEHHDVIGALAVIGTLETTESITISNVLKEKADNGKTIAEISR